MPIITLPDGKQLSFDAPVSVETVAGHIGKRLAEAALAARVNGQPVDTSFMINEDASVEILIDRDEAGLEVIRHSTAHLLAQAVKQLFPEAKVTIGPVIEDGFYYDFSYPPGFTEADLAKIEARMHEISKQNLKVTRKMIGREEAISLFQSMGEEYKVKIIQDIATTEKLSFYQQGDWLDLCRGPHVPSTGKIKVFKLTKVAGAYWRGDSKNEMLQRIYGTAWANQKDLDAYLFRIQEAEKRDHRKIGKKLDLFHLQEEAPGMVFWHPKGWALYQVIEQYIRQRVNSQGYQEIRTPQVLERSLWERSGHWRTFRDNMFALEIDHRDFAIKPMSCPCHIQVFNQGLKSYRDLPLRFAEFGFCHRFEPSGALHGLLRVRHFVQDDGHIFCTEDQIQQEVARFNQLLLDVYRDFGFEELIIKLATRPEKRVGSEAGWDKAEQALELALNQSGLAWTFSPGEGAFYGPKIEYSCKDALGRIWQLGTMQVDPSMPELLGASYIAEDGSKKIPVMLHRAIIGTLERFIGILLEETSGSLPPWLAPIQAVVLNITDSQTTYAQECGTFLRAEGFRVEEDLRNEKIGFKIREHTLQRVPFLLVVGDRELAARTVSVRTREGEDLGSMSLESFKKKLTEEIAKRNCRAETVLGLV